MIFEDIEEEDFRKEIRKVFGNKEIIKIKIREDYIMEDTLKVKPLEKLPKSIFNRFIKVQRFEYIIFEKEEEDSEICRIAHWINKRGYIESFATSLEDIKEHLIRQSEWMDELIKNMPKEL